MSIDNLSKQEIKLISVLVFLYDRNRKSNKENIISIIKLKFNSLIQSWEIEVDKLIKKDYVKLCKQEIVLTEKGNRTANYIRDNKILIEFFYDEFYEMAEKSKAHSKFCKEVYGKDLCQHGMADIVQLKPMIDDIVENNIQDILDIGCGNGMITEYISDLTGYRLVGIDISKTAIKRATARTKGNEKLKFIDADIEKLDATNQNFGAVIAIDSLYFVRNLSATLVNLLKLLNNNGRMYLYYSFPSEMIKSNLELELDKLGMNYEIINLTRSNHLHWIEKKKVLENLRQKFYDESCAFLYNNRMTECKGKIYTFKRYLYIVKC